MDPGREAKLAWPATAAIRRLDTERLIPSRFAATTDSVLQPIADDDQHLNDLFDLDNATNQRLVGEFGGLPGIGIDELVFGIPNFRIINAEFHDLRRGRRFKDCLNPQSYIPSQSLAVQLLANGLLGLVYPSGRHAAGTNLVCFRPALVGNVRKAEAYRMTWSGTPEPLIETM